MYKCIHLRTCTHAFVRMYLQCTYLVLPCGYDICVINGFAETHWWPLSIPSQAIVLKKARSTVLKATYWSIWSVYTTCNVLLDVDHKLLNFTELRICAEYMYSMYICMCILDTFFFFILPLGKVGTTIRTYMYVHIDSVIAFENCAWERSQALANTILGTQLSRLTHYCI